MKKKYMFFICFISFISLSCTSTNETIKTLNSAFVVNDCLLPNSLMADTCMFHTSQQGYNYYRIISYDILWTFWMNYSDSKKNILTQVISIKEMGELANYMKNNDYQYAISAGTLGKFIYLITIQTKDYESFTYCEEKYWREQ